MSEPGVGRFLVAFSVQGVVFIILLFVIELQCVRTLRRLLTSLCRRRKRVNELWERWTRQCLSFSVSFFFLLRVRMETLSYIRTFLVTTAGTVLRWRSLRETIFKVCWNVFKLKPKNRKVSIENLSSGCRSTDHTDVIKCTGNKQNGVNTSWKGNFNSEVT